jgi:hypothetical protein
MMSLFLPSTAWKKRCRLVVLIRGREKEDLFRLVDIHASVDEPLAETFVYY